MNIQAVLFKIVPRWSNSKDRLDYLKKNNLKAIKRVHKTETYYRYRIQEPDYKKFNYFLKRGINDIDFIVAIPINT